MDPLSIICGAGSAAQGVVWVSTRLYTFATSSVHVEKTLSELRHEVDSLKAVLQAIETSLKGPAAARKGRAAADDEEVWGSLDMAITDTQYTVKALQGTVEALTTTKSTSFFKRAVKQAKLNLDADEIKEIKDRIHTHTSCLQLALQMATILISSHSSDHIHEIGPKLDKIIQDLRSSPRTLHKKLPSTFTNPDIQTHTERLISSASTVIGQRSTVSGGSEMDFPNGSEAGGSLGRGKISHIENWIPELTITEEEGSQTSEHKAPTAISETLVEERGMEAEDIDYSDSDGDDNYDFAQESFEQAEKCFSNDEHAKAVEFFRAGLKRANRLAIEKQNRLEIGNIKRELALSLLYQGDLDESQELFQSLAKAGNGDKKSVGLAFHASSGLAIVCLCKRSYEGAEGAEDWCDKTRKGWRRIVGRQHPLHIESLKLTAFLCELRGDSAGATVNENQARKCETGVDKSSTPKSLGFPFEQVRDLVTRYHQAHPASEAPDHLHVSLSEQYASTIQNSTSHVTLPGQYASTTQNFSHMMPNDGTATTPNNLTSHVSLPGQNASTTQNLSHIMPNKYTARGDRVQATHLKPSTPNNPTSPTSDTSIFDIGKSPGTTPGTTPGSSPLSESNKGFKDSITAQSPPPLAIDSRASSFTLAPLRDYRLSSRTESTISKDALSLSSESQAGKKKSLSSKVQDSRTRSALFSAAEAGNLASIDKALKKGAPVDAKNAKGETALCRAVISGHAHAVEALIKHGASIESRNKQGCTPLLCAKENISQSRTAVMRTLLTAGAEINVPDNFGDTALAFAVTFCRPDWVKCLLEFNPALEIRNSVGRTALLCAVDFLVIAYPKPLLETVKLLIEAGAHVEAKDDKEQSAVLIVVRAIATRTSDFERYWYDYTSLIEMLCATGADATALSVKGVGPLSLTGQIKDVTLRDGVRKILRKYGAT